MPHEKNMLEVPREKNMDLKSVQINVRKIVSGMTKRGVGIQTN